MKESAFGSYLGMNLQISALDSDNLAYFSYCAKHDYRLQQCEACALIRFPPGSACPWCAHADYSWVSVAGQGHVYSYTRVEHAIQPAFKEKTPYMVLLVELTTQGARPSEHEALRVIGNLVASDGSLAGPDLMNRVGINTRVRMVFNDVSDSIAVPLWTLDETADQPAKPWRFDDAANG